MNDQVEFEIGPPVDAGIAATRLGAPLDGVLAGSSVEGLLDILLGATPPGRIILAGSLVPLWGARLDAAGRAWHSLHIDGRTALDTLMDAVSEAQAGDQVWLNLDRSPSLDFMDLLTLDAFLAFAASRPLPPLVVLMRDDAPSLSRTQRLAVDRLTNVLLLREGLDGAYAIGRPELLEALAGGRPRRPLPLMAPLRKSKHLLVLDVDGVLIDPGKAFSEAVAGALGELAPDLPWNDGLFEAFKRVGGFNNDFRLTAAALALAEADGFGLLESAIGVGFPHLEARIQALEPQCQAAVQKHYARSRRLERPLVRRSDLSVFNGELAILTGRPPVELAMAFEVLGFRLPAVSDSAPHLRKPRPEGLLQLADTYRAGRVTFVGDTCDDAAALQGARELRPDIAWTFAAVGPERARFAKAGDLQGECLKDVLAELEDRSRS